MQPGVFDAYNQEQDGTEQSFQKRIVENERNDCKYGYALEFVPLKWLFFPIFCYNFILLKLLV